MRILCVFGQHNYGDAARGEGYEFANFIPALRALGHTVQHFESWNRDAFTDFAALNRALLDTAATTRPDLVFCVLMNYEVWIETLRSLRGAGIAVLNWGTDDSWKYAQFTRLIAREFDLWVTTADSARAAASRDGLTNLRLSQWGASRARTAAPLPDSQCRHDISFVGSAYGNRARWIRRLGERGLDITCFGHGWPSGPVSADDIPEIHRHSRLSLNFGDSGLQWNGLRPYRSRQIKARVFEVPAAGGCLLTESADGLQRYYTPGVELEQFTDEADLVAKARVLLADPARRDAMARAGHARTLREHLYEQRFEPLLAECISARTAKPRRADVDHEAFAAACDRHRTTPMLRGLRRMLDAPFMLLWGRQRGARAARRLVFELSWRLVGAPTYGAAGVPGRLYYRES